MSIEQLKASTGFSRTPLQVGPDNDAFLGFVAFACGACEEARILVGQFIAEGGIRDTHNAGDIPRLAGQYIDWLIANHWGEEINACQVTAPAVHQSSIGIQ